MTASTKKMIRNIFAGIIISVGSSASVGTFLIAVQWLRWKEGVDNDIKTIKSDVSQNVLRTDGLYPIVWKQDTRISVLESKQQK